MIGESNKRQRSADSIAPLPQPDPLFLLPTDLEEWLGTADGSQTPAALDLFDQVMEAQNELAQSNPQPVPMGNAGHSQGQTWPTRMGSNAAAASDAYSWNYASGRDANPPVADSMYGHRGMAPTFGGDSMVDPRFGESSYHTPSGAPAPAEYPYADLISNKFASLKLYQSIDGKGHVWKGSWNGIVVAVKMIKVEQSMEADVLRRFKKLTHILDGIEHPNICKYFGNTMHQGHPFMVHEFIGGGSLHSFLHGSSDDSASWLPALPPRLLSRIALETASAVAYLHSKGVLHRNIKAASVLLDDDQHVKLADFGLSTTLASDLTAETGTYRWMAPEVIGHRKYDDKCDVHSYGMLLWELTHRKIPFQGRGALQAAFAVVQGERPPISLSGELQPFGNVIESCWQHLPTARPNMAKVVTMVQVPRDSPEMKGVRGFLIVVRSSCRPSTTDRAQCTHNEFLSSTHRSTTPPPPTALIVSTRRRPTRTCIPRRTLCLTRDMWWSLLPRLTPWVLQRWAFPRWVRRWALRRWALRRWAART